jgi:hypothetical protein
MGWTEWIKINSPSTSKLPKKLLCGIATNYMKYRTISHSVTLEALLTTARFIKVTFIYIITSVNTNTVIWNLILSYNNFSLTQTLLEQSSYNHSASDSEPTTHCFSKHMATPGVHRDSDKSSLHYDVWMEHQRVCTYILHLKWIICCI